MHVKHILDLLFCIKLIVKYQVMQLCNTHTHTVVFNPHCKSGLLAQTTTENLIFNDFCSFKMIKLPKRNHSKKAQIKICKTGVVSSTHDATNQGLH